MSLSTTETICQMCGKQLGMHFKTHLYQLLQPLWVRQGCIQWNCRTSQSEDRLSHHLCAAFRSPGFLGYMTLNAAQKMLEEALSADLGTILFAASSMEPASPYGVLSWDSHGRFSNPKQVMYQTGLVKTGWDLKLVYPFSVGYEVRSISFKLSYCPVCSL
jgi:hypothetical protein